MGLPRKRYSLHNINNMANKMMLFVLNVLNLSTLTSAQGSYPFFNKKFKDFSRTFKDTFFYFSRTSFSAKKSLEPMSFLVLPQHE